MKLTVTQHKWLLNIVMLIGGVLVGIGVTDCIMALNQMNLDQGARGLTIFSAGVTILVLIDNTKTQQVTEQTQQETLQQLRKVEALLLTLSPTEQPAEKLPRQDKNMVEPVLQDEDENMLKEKLG